MYSPEVVEKICDGIATSNRGLQRILEEDDALPSVGTFMRWLKEKPELREAYAHAKALQTEFLEAEILDISDDENADAYIEMVDGKPVAKLDGSAVQRSKLRVDTRKWLMAHLRPKVYGDRIDVTSGGEKLAQPAAPVLVDARIQSLVLIAQRRLGEPIELSAEPSIEELMC